MGFLIGFFFMFGNIKLAIAIIKTAADCVKDNMLMMVVPPVMSIFVFAFWGAWVIGIIYMWSVGTPSKSPDGPYAAMSHTKE